jgi:hypothetical protein
LVEEQLEEEKAHHTKFLRSARRLLACKANRSLTRQPRWLMTVYHHFGCRMLADASSIAGLLVSAAERSVSAAPAFTKM